MKALLVRLGKALLVHLGEALQDVGAWMVSQGWQR